MDNLWDKLVRTAQEVLDWWETDSDHHGEFDRLRQVLEEVRDEIK